MNTKQLTINERAITLALDGIVCRLCGNKDKLEIHHIIPRRLNGSNHHDNLITLCKTCHSKIENRDKLKRQRALRCKIIKVYEITCHKCNRKFTTGKKIDVQCFGCGERFDL